MRYISDEQISRHSEIEVSIEQKIVELQLHRVAEQFTFDLLSCSDFIFVRVHCVELHSVLHFAKAVPLL